MIPAPPSIYKSPHCGALKTIRALISGNGCGTVQWSDFKKYSPMLPNASYVQRCPSCRNYYLLSNETYYRSVKSFACGASWGDLSYPSLRDAFKQLSPKGNDELYFRLKLIHAYNDLYGGCKGTKLRTDAPSSEKKFFKDNVKALLFSWGDIKEPLDRLFMAELYREIGQFYKAIRILRASFNYKEEQLEIFRNQILERAEQKDSNVFIVDGSENHKRKAVIVDDKGFLYDEELDLKYKIKDDLPF